MTEDEDEIITLNVGGTLFSTLKSSLKKKIGDDEHYLSILLSSQFKVLRDKHGNIFIDRDPLCFPYILNYLRSGGKICDYLFPWFVAL